MPRYGMVIDLQNCVGCGACALACKSENNTGDRLDGQSFNWADFIHEMSGIFPNVDYAAIPVLCNHCAKAPCVEVCPTEPKAMYKTPEGITMHNDERCIGCRACQEACPYSELDLTDPEKGNAYSVISFNEDANACYSRSTSDEALLRGRTFSGAGVSKRAGATPAWRTEFSHPDYGNVRRAGITEKCTFCHHRLAVGKQPWCVESCPSGARIFGDLADPSSAPAQALQEHTAWRLKDDAGTEPAVFYIREFKARKGEGVE